MLRSDQTLRARSIGISDVHEILERIMDNSCASIASRRYASDTGVGRYGFGLIFDHTNRSKLVSVLFALFVRRWWH